MGVILGFRFVPGPLEAANQSPHPTEMCMRQTADTPGCGELVNSEGLWSHVWMARNLGLKLLVPGGDVELKGWLEGFRLQFHGEGRMSST